MFTYLKDKTKSRKQDDQSPNHQVSIFVCDSACGCLPATPLKHFFFSKLWTIQAQNQMFVNEMKEGSNISPSQEWNFTSNSKMTVSVFLPVQKNFGQIFTITASICFNAKNQKQPRFPIFLSTKIILGCKKDVKRTG